MIVNARGQVVYGYEAAYCSATRKLTAAERLPDGSYRCVGCGAVLRLVDTDPPQQARRAA